MRDILFRGKRIDNGEWVKGSYIYVHKGNWDGTSSHLISNLYGTEKSQILPETLSQFTGLSDKNCKRIFEGDILKDGYGNIKVVVYTNTRFILRNKDNHKCSSWQYADKHEIVGNIHDNPELLKGE